MSEPTAVLNSDVDVLRAFLARRCFFVAFVSGGWCLYMPFACVAIHARLNVCDILRATVAVCAIFRLSAELF